MKFVVCQKCEFRIYIDTKIYVNMKCPLCSGKMSANRPIYTSGCKPSSPNMLVLADMINMTTRALIPISNNLGDYYSFNSYNEKSNINSILENKDLPTNESDLIKSLSTGVGNCQELSLLVLLIVSKLKLSFYKWEKRIFITILETSGHHFCLMHDNIANYS